MTGSEVVQAPIVSIHSGAIAFAFSLLHLLRHTFISIAPLLESRHISINTFKWKTALAFFNFQTDAPHQLMSTIQYLLTAFYFMTWLHFT